MPPGVLHCLTDLLNIDIQFDRPLFQVWRPLVQLRTSILFSECAGKSPALKRMVANQCATPKDPGHV